MGTAYFKEGDRVLVNYPEDEAAVTIGMKDFNEKEFVISKVVRGSARQTGTCELEGAKSPLGTPYTFYNDWLIRVKE